MKFWDRLFNALFAKGNGFFVSISMELPTFYTKPKGTKMSNRWNYFTDAEVEGLQSEFIAQLDMARKIAGIPFVITSGLRSPSKNQSIIGAVPDSAHLKGLAVDLAVTSSNDVWKITTALKEAGINRVGVYVNADMKPVHIHCDADPDKVAEVLFIKQEAKA